MKWHKPFFSISVLLVSTGLLVLAFCLGGAPDVGTSVIGAEPSADEPSTARVTLELTNAGSSLVWFGPTQTMQAKTGDEWLAPQKLDRRLSWIVLRRFRFPSFRT
jgi:hypothetical protein